MKTITTIFLLINLLCKMCCFNTKILTNNKRKTCICMLKQLRKLNCVHIFLFIKKRRQVGNLMCLKFQKYVDTATVSSSWNVHHNKSKIVKLLQQCRWEVYPWET